MGDLYDAIKKSDTHVYAERFKEDKVEYVLFSEIMAPDDNRPFAHQRFTLFVTKDNFRKHNTTPLRLHVESFYTQEFWKPMFQNVYELLMDKKTS